MSLAAKFPDITKANELLAPYTHLKIGGPAEFFVQPRSVEELKAVLQHCHAERIPLRMLGGGYNLLIRDEPIPGAVLRLNGDDFSRIEAQGTQLRAAGGAQLLDLIRAAVRQQLTGLETLIGLRGTVGGSVRCNVGDRTGEIGACVRRVAVLTDSGTEQIRTREELNFGDHSSDLDEPVILWVDFELEADQPEAILKRMKRAWIVRKASEPLTYQCAVRMFRNPMGQSAAKLIERAGLTKTRVGAAEVSERNANYAIAHPGTTAKDLLNLLELVKLRVEQGNGLTLQQELNIW